jgi:hypothetical protein
LNLSHNSNIREHILKPDFVIIKFQNSSYPLLFFIIIQEIACAGNHNNQTLQQMN